ncbi:uncharacterized protein LOC142320399 [Lycorma delicatula]|uniref:uncharacterized protein LOC142320399 n=1 Tax=Lycorma delicatula TaxID=130591 RepID=UPI003F515029
MDASVKSFFVGEAPSSVTVKIEPQTNEAEKTVSLCIETVKKENNTLFEEEMRNKLESVHLTRESVPNLETNEGTSDFGFELSKCIKKEENDFIHEVDLGIDTVNDLMEKNEGSSVVKYLASNSDVTSEENFCEKITVKSEFKQQNYKQVMEFKCNYCGKMFKSKNGLTEHIDAHINERRFVCSICGKSFNRKRSLKSHIEIHISSEKIYSCSYCPKSFTKKAYLRIHLKIHSDGRTFTCNYCQKSFKQKGYLMAHVRKIHTTLKKYVCKYLIKENSKDIKEFKCEKKFKTEHGLMEHINGHINEKSYNCKFCEKSFSSKQTLREHVNTHDDSEKVFKCSYCQKSFTQKKYLRVHLRIHTTKKIFYCRFCPQSFEEKICLTTHLKKIHYDEKKFTCKFCQKRFNSKRYLLKHFSFHTSERKYVCSFCQKTFFYKNSLNKHYSMHINEKKCVCVFCQKTFIISQETDPPSPFSCRACDVSRKITLAHSNSACGTYRW